MVMAVTAEPSSGSGAVDRPAGPAADGPAGLAAGQPAAPARAGLRWWVIAAAAVVLGAAAGAQIVQAVRPGTPAAGSSAPFVSTGGIFTKGDGQPAPAWVLPGLADPAHTVTLRQFRGRPVVVNFWASWCTPCRKEMPALEQVSRLLAGRVAFAGLDTQDQRAAGLAFARSRGVTYPLATANARVWAAYGVTALPTTFFISARGTLLGEDFGGMTRTSLLALIRQLYGITSHT
jgi:cytochrome c biogenesis protein CcmG, thiol:disulfide interchange protein DsbE